VHTKSRGGDNSLAHIREGERDSYRLDFMPVVQLPPTSATPLGFRLDPQHLPFLASAASATPKLLARRWLRRFSALCAFPDADLLPLVECYVSSARIMVSDPRKVNSSRRTRRCKSLTHCLSAAAASSNLC
jgi:hypothetical protein